MEAAARYYPLAAEETGIAAGMARKKVLLADDAELLLDLEKKILVREGVTVLTAGNGREALDLVRRERPDLVFLDLDMPVMDGDECCRRIREDPTAEVDPGRHGQRQSSGGFPAALPHGRLRCHSLQADRPAENGRGRPPPSRFSLSEATAGCRHGCVSIMGPAAGRCWPIIQ